jgi:hypothetical protein
MEGVMTTEKPGKTYQSMIESSGRTLRVKWVTELFERELDGLAFAVGGVGGEYGCRISREDAIDIAKTICERYGVSIDTEVEVQRTFIATVVEANA